jgi:hypothetical protein
VFALGDLTRYPFHLQRNLPSRDFAGATAFPLWAPMRIENHTSQGIYYNVYGNSPSRTVVFEFNATIYEKNSQYCHFQVLFFEAHPGIVQFIYLNISEGDNYAFIGVQGKSVYE